MTFWTDAWRRLQERAKAAKEKEEREAKRWRFLAPDAPQTSDDPPCPGCGRRGLVNADNGTVRCVICTRRFDNQDVQVKK